MGTIVLLALAAAVYPQLLAVVLLILTLPKPRLLLWVCCGSSLVVSVIANTAIFAVFRGRGTIAGTSESRLGSLAYLVIGAVALGIGLFLASSLGRETLARARRVAGSATHADASGANPTEPAGRHSFGVKVRSAVTELRRRSDDALRDGSLIFAAVTGALLAIPGPFDLLAVGHLARSGHAVVAAFWAIGLFALIKFALIEIPSLAYAINPDGTADRVSRFSAWIHANTLLAAAAVVGFVGLLLIGRGVVALF